MYYIERQSIERQWIRELRFKTEFKALVNARSKAIATLATYRVIHSTWPSQVLHVVNGFELVKSKKLDLDRLTPRGWRDLN